MLESLKNVDFLGNGLCQGGIGEGRVAKEGYIKLYTFLNLHFLFYLIVN